MLHMPNYLMDIQVLEISFFKKKYQKLYFICHLQKINVLSKVQRAVECLALLEELGNVFYLKHVPAVFYQIFIFNQMIALQKL